MKKGFTLSEILITLGIIGTVAAITMPALIQSHRKHETVTKLKKIYSAVNQAIKISEIEYGEQINWDMDCGTSTVPTCSTEQAIEKFNTYIGKNLDVIQIQPNRNGNSFYVYLKDGSILCVLNWLYDYRFYLNKKAISNSKSGINQFSFRFNPKLPDGQSAIQNLDFGKGTFEPYSYNWDGTREHLINKTNYSCNGTSHAYCAKLIQYDGWQILKDYPLRF